MAIFDPRFAMYTPDAKMNFIGAARKYFDEINKENLDKTNNIYIEYYNNNIFPYINLAKDIESYDLEYVEDLILLIQKKNEYSDSTVRSIIRHLMYDPCKYYFDEHYPGNNIFSVNPSDFKAEEGFEDDEDGAELRIVRSLTISEEKKAFKSLMVDPKNVTGEYLGLLIMFFTASRNNEACGFNYGDLIEMIDHKGCYYLQITKTTTIKSNDLKAGGKTYNAPRRLPLVSVLADYLLKRIDCLETIINFPYESNGVVYKSVYELPIACRGMNFGERANSDNLTVVGRDFLRNEIGMSKSRVAGLQRCILNDRDTEFDLGEKDVTTYLLRRNMATHLYTLGFSILESQYYMGHKMEGTALRRSDFGDEEFLFALWNKIQNHPLNKLAQNKPIDLKNGIVLNEYHSQLNLSKGNYLIKIVGREQSDSVKIDVLNSTDAAIEIIDGVIFKNPEEEINILKLIKNEYKKGNSK